MRKGRKNKIFTQIIEQQKKKNTYYIVEYKKKKNTPSYYNLHYGEASRLSIMKHPPCNGQFAGVFPLGSASHPFLNSQVRWQPAGRPFNFTAPSEFLIYAYKFWNRGWRRTGLQSGDVRTVQSSSPHNIARSLDNFLNFAVSPAGSVVKGSK